MFKAQMCDFLATLVPLNVITRHQSNVKPTSTFGTKKKKKKTGPKYKTFYYDNTKRQRISFVVGIKYKLEAS